MKMKVLLGIVIFLVIIIVYNYIQISKFSVNELVFNSNKLNNDLRITQVTDYHGNSLIDGDLLIDDIKRFDPHLIVLTGDIIDYKTKDIVGTLNLVKRMYDINNNTFFVIGNHELRNGKGNEFISKLENMGITILDDENTVLKVNGENINIIGLSFFATKEDYESAINGVNDENYTLLLSHSPNRPISYLSEIEDLVLSGHTHGGQVRLPLIGAILAPGQGYFPKYDKGTFELGNTTLYIDSGLGNSVLPIRLFNRVQISNITIKATVAN